MIETSLVSSGLDVDAGRRVAEALQRTFARN
jgi:hypothetical protein